MSPSVFAPDRRSTQRATARAGSNIAFIKYWGVADPVLNLPLSNSISMTLADAYTTTSVEWDTRGGLLNDEVTIDGIRLDARRAERIARHLERMRVLASVSYRARVVSQNNFPMASGIASSASGFAALTVAGCTALGLELTPTQLSALARRGSGSASRSLFGGYVEWEKGRDDASSAARQIQPADHWDLQDIVAIVSAAEKAVSSESGHLLAVSSPFNMSRIDHIDALLTEVRSAIATRDIERLGVVIERDALAMHAVMMTSTPEPALLAAGHARSDAGRAAVARAGQAARLLHHRRRPQRTPDLRVGLSRHSRRPPAGAQERPAGAGQQARPRPHPA